MSPEEVQLLQDSGQLFLLNLAYVACMMALYGVYLVPASMACLSLWRRGLQTRATMLLFSALVTVFVTFTIEVASVIAIVSGQIRGMLVANPEEPLEVRFQLASQSIRFWALCEGWVANSSNGIMFWVGDAVVVWRTCVLLRQQRKTQIVLIFFLLFGISFAIARSIYSTALEPSARVVSNTSIQSILGITSGAYFILLNATATALIGWQTYRHRQQVKSSLSANRSKALGIMLLITESGFMYCIAQIVAAALSIADTVPLSPIDWAASFWKFLAVFASAMYPIVVILIVNNRYSIADTLLATDMLPSMSFPNSSKTDVNAPTAATVSS